MAMLLLGNNRDFDPVDSEPHGRVALAERPLGGRAVTVFIAVLFVLAAARSVVVGPTAQPDSCAPTTAQHQVAAPACTSAAPVTGSHHLP